MSMPTRIILNSRALSAGQAAVSSPTALIPVSFPDVVAGNKTQYRFFLADGFGNFEAFSGNVADYTLKLAIGDPVTRTSLKTTTSFTSSAETIEGISTAAWTATLDFSDAAVLAAVANKDSVEGYYMELQVTETASSQVVTYCQMKVLLRNRILS